jgi:tetratricopeptide (TPR) repeat protein
MAEILDRHIFPPNHGGEVMKAPSVSCFSKILFVILFVAGLMLIPNLAPAQDKEQEKPAAYTDEEYKVYQDIQAEKDPVKKTDMIVKFLQEKPSTGLRKWIESDFHRPLDDLRTAKNWTQVIALGEKFLSVAPKDEFTIVRVTAAYEATGNTKGFATLGEKLYGFKPTAELALAIATAYQKLGNDAKYTQWKEKVLVADPDNLQNLAEMTQKYMGNQNKVQALKNAKKIISILPTAKRPASIDEATWKNIASNAGAIAYAVVGSDAYENRRYAEAIINLDNSVKNFKKNEQAYFLLGMCYWQQNKLDAAMLNFAKAYLIKGSLAATAKTNLEQLWKNTHRNSLAGINRITEQAQQDLK